MFKLSKSIIFLLELLRMVAYIEHICMHSEKYYRKQIFVKLQNLFFSSPIRNPASANAAKRLPAPASFPVTAYSLTKAWSILIAKRRTINKSYESRPPYLGTITWCMIKLMSHRIHVARRCIYLNKNQRVRVVLQLLLHVPKSMTPHIERQ